MKQLILAACLLMSTQVFAATPEYFPSPNDDVRTGGSTSIGVMPKVPDNGPLVYRLDNSTMGFTEKLTLPKKSNDYGSAVMVLNKSDKSTFINTDNSSLSKPLEIEPNHGVYVYFDKVKGIWNPDVPYVITAGPPSGQVNVAPSQMP
ncbi:hypothetical protein [Pseudomonas sp. R76]|uniref:hypothetical protein n=1 Tax=Pseudomonas sp. R76 TaxID=1573711 RepID=UPI00135A7569|nr:hypothetical protein [Pseudomonas sp. R76]